MGLSILQRSGFYYGMKFPKRLEELRSKSRITGKVLMAVAEGSCEGTTYYSDIYGYEDDIKILEKMEF